MSGDPSEIHGDKARAEFSIRQEEALVTCEAKRKALVDLIDGQ